MWRMPNRPRNEISQTYNDGILTVYAVDPGTVPDRVSLAGLTEKAKLLYSERRLGVQRYFAGIQAQIRIDRVVRCQKTDYIAPHDVVITENGKHYSVQMVQPCYDVYPPSVDISLTAIEEHFDSAVLICRTYGDGAWIETGREVKCSVHAVDVKEFYAAHSADFRPELTMVLPDYREYNDETLVDYAGKRYRILRASRSEQQISLTLERASEEEQEAEEDDL